MPMVDTVTSPEWGLTRLPDTEAYAQGTALTGQQRQEGTCHAWSTCQVAAAVFVPPSLALLLPEPDLS